jgi:hypothetical protein
MVLYLNQLIELCAHITTLNKLSLKKDLEVPYHSFLGLPQRCTGSSDRPTFGGDTPTGRSGHLCRRRKSSKPNSNNFSGKRKRPLRWSRADMSSRSRRSCLHRRLLRRKQNSVSVLTIYWVNILFKWLSVYDTLFTQFKETQYKLN